MGLQLGGSRPKHSSWHGAGRSIVFWALAAVLFAIIGYLCFHKLGDLPIMDWDEARHGVSAYEMSQSGDLIVTTFDGEPDYWNLKPPLSEWLICLAYSIFGYNVFGMRVYGAISALICIALCFLWSWKRIGRTGALTCVFAFAGIWLLWQKHCFRAGDADALFVLLCTTGTLCLAECTKEPKTLIGACLAFSLAFLAKSFHAGILAVEIVVCCAYFLYKKTIRLSLSLVLCCVAAAIGPILIWAILRMLRDGTAFFEQMVLYDLLKRSSEAIENHVGGPLFYVEILLSDWGVIACLACLPVGVAHLVSASQDESRVMPHDQKIDSFIVLASAVLIPLGLFTLASSKLRWYIFPALPALVLLAGMCVQSAVIRLGGPKAALVLAVPFLICGLSVFTSIAGVREGNGQDPVQTSISQLVSRNGPTANADLYLYAPGDTDEYTGTWSQSRYLLAMLQGNMHPVDGAVQGWSDDDDALLLTTAKKAKSISQGSTETLGTSGDYVLVRHKKP